MRADTLTDALRLMRPRVSLQSFQAYANGVVTVEYGDGPLTGSLTPDGATLRMGGRAVTINNPRPPFDHGAAGLDNGE